MLLNVAPTIWLYQPGNACLNRSCTLFFQPFFCAFSCQPSDSETFFFLCVTVVVEVFPLVRNDLRMWPQLLWATPPFLWRFPHYLFKTPFRPVDGAVFLSRCLKSPARALNQRNSHDIPSCYLWEATETRLYSSINDVKMERKNKTEWIIILTNDLVSVRWSQRHLQEPVPQCHRLQGNPTLASLAKWGERWKSSWEQSQELEAETHSLPPPPPQNGLYTAFIWLAAATVFI